METVLRIVIIYIILLAALRVMGKREFAELSPIELVTLLIIPEIVSQSLIREDFSLTNAIIGLATLFILVFINTLLTHRSKRASKILQSQPTVLVENGHMFEDAMNREHIPPNELFSQMHSKGFTELDQVKWAILEDDGKIAFIPVKKDTK